MPVGERRNLARSGHLATYHTTFLATSTASSRTSPHFSLRTTMSGTRARLMYQARNIGRATISIPFHRIYSLRQSSFLTILPNATNSSNRSSNRSSSDNNNLPISSTVLPCHRDSSDSRCTYQQLKHQQQQQPSRTTTSKKELYLLPQTLSHQATIP